MKILVGEDNPLNQELLLMMLEMAGHSADVAGNGLEVLAAVDKTNYDLILMDLQMPEMDGRTAAREIGRRLGASRPRIVALTAMEPSAREDCFDGFLSKPVSRAELARVLEGFSPSAPSENELPSEYPTLDLAVFVDSAGEEAEFQSHFARVFVAELASGIEQLNQAVQTQDLTTVSQTAHSVKGASASMGALRLANLCHGLEGCRDWGSEQRESILQQSVQAVAAEFECVKQALALMIA